jgi:hypothetical protein
MVQKTFITFDLHFKNHFNGLYYYHSYVEIDYYSTNFDAVNCNIGFAYNYERLILDKYKLLLFSQ